METDIEQQGICNKYGADFWKSSEDLKVGIALNVKEGVLPVNGLRLRPDSGTTGWFIWGGEYSNDPNFFVPLHVKHLNEWCPNIMKYLGLPPGWRFLFAPGYEDVWQDIDLLSADL